MIESLCSAFWQCIFRQSTFWQSLAVALNKAGSKFHEQNFFSTKRPSDFMDLILSVSKLSNSKHLLFPFSVPVHVNIKIALLLVLVLVVSNT